jgi:chemotaxis protein CheZ
MTEDSAHKTLNAVDQSLPIAEELQQRATELHDKWSRFRQKNMVLDEFRALVPEIDSFLELTTHHAGTLNANLSEVMMAQGFQDLTGQIIRRVINLVTEVEDNLVHLVRISGQHFMDTAPESEDEEKDMSKGYGPQVPGVDAGTEVVNSQDDVDELLSSLGF